MAQSWETIDSCPKEEGQTYDLWVIQYPDPDGNFTHPPRRLTDCEFIPPPVYINQANTHDSSLIPREYWNWCSPDMGMLPPDRFNITHWMDKPLPPQ